jgi:hypothetical protein
MAVSIKEKNEMINKLSGMSFAQGKYTPEKWEEKVGVNPLKLPDYIKIISGKCYWTDKAESYYQSLRMMTSKNWKSLGV